MDIITATAAKAPAANTSETMFAELDGQAFLRLLVAQLQHQDPLNPLSNEQFMSEMTQLSSLEKLQSIDDTLTSSTAAAELGLAASFIGRHVEWLDATGVGHRGTVMEVTHDGSGTALVVGAARVPLHAVVRVVQHPEDGSPNQDKGMDEL